MGAIAADVVLVLGDVGEVREIAEGAHDRQRLVVVETVDCRRQFAPRAGLVVAMEPDRGLTDALDILKCLFALLLAHGVAENAPQQADVLAQRGVLLVVVQRSHGRGRRGGNRHGRLSGRSARVANSLDLVPRAWARRKRLNVKQAPRQGATGAPRGP